MINHIVISDSLWSSEAETAHEETSHISFSHNQLSVDDVLGVLTLDDYEIFLVLLVHVINTMSRL